MDKNISQCFLVVRRKKIVLSLGLSFPTFLECVCRRLITLTMLSNNATVLGVWAFTSIDFKDSLLGRRLIVSLIFATEIIDHIASNMHSCGDDCRWERTVLGHTFSMSRASCPNANEGVKTVVDTFKSWLHAHEEAQVMLASLLVVIGLWWLVRTVLALLINLVCPILVVLVAVTGLLPMFLYEAEVLGNSTIQKAVPSPFVAFRKYVQYEVCVPQLRAPLLGQNYPLLANLLRNILMKMADNIQT